MRRITEIIIIVQALGNSPFLTRQGNSNLPIDQVRIDGWPDCDLLNAISVSSDPVLVMRSRPGQRA
jgi:hypothetical protein